MVSESEFETKEQRIARFRRMFAGSSSDALFLEIAKYGEDSPVAERIAASLVLSQRKQDMETRALAASEQANQMTALKHASEIKQWWLIVLCYVLLRPLA